MMMSHSRMNHEPLINIVMAFFSLAILLLLCFTPRQHVSRQIRFKYATTKIKSKIYWIIEFLRKRNSGDTILFRRLVENVNYIKKKTESTLIVFNDFKKVLPIYRTRRVDTDLRKYIYVLSLWHWMCVCVCFSYSSCFNIKHTEHNLWRCQNQQPNYR